MTSSYLTGVLPQTGVQAGLLPVLTTPAELRAALAGADSIGLVPTMGALHAGHATLIEQARRENSVVVVSIFINPLQFGPGEDLSRYPRMPEQDRVTAQQAGADLIFHPDAATMYPADFASTVSVGSLSSALEGASRPGHFDGVATVVLKLFNLVRPDRAYFGEKDWQQLSVIRQMVRDLNVSVDVVGVPTVRVQGGPADGLALSSRNSYLTAEWQTRAGVLSRALRSVQEAYAGGERHPAALLAAGQATLNSEPELQLDYLSLVDEGLQVWAQLPAGGTVPVSRQGLVTDGAHNERMFRLLIAARMFGVRLIDNMPLLPQQATGQSDAPPQDSDPQDGTTQDHTTQGHTTQDGAGQDGTGL